jgi:hydrogenase maturation protease
MTEFMQRWRELERPGPETVTVDGVVVRVGSRVRLHPRPGGDVFDMALRGRTAVVEGIDESLEGDLHVAVVLEEDPGRGLGEARQIGHRFFFSLDEIEPAEDAAGLPQPPSILVAGIGNVFLGDDGFGVAVAERLQRRDLPAGVRVVDFGIRGIDLVHALQADPDVAILLDAVPGGENPGTLSVIEPQLEAGGAAIDPHGMDPVKVLHTARELGARPGRTLVVGCEPLVRMSGDEPDVVMELSEPVRAAVDEAVLLVESLIGEVLESLDTERTVES